MKAPMCRRFASGLQCNLRTFGKEEVDDCRDSSGPGAAFCLGTPQQKRCIGKQPGLWMVVDKVEEREFLGSSIMKKCKAKK